MCMHSLIPICIVSVMLGCASPATKETPNLGRLATTEEIIAWDVSIPPDGTGLPPGSGTPAQGVTVYAQKCLACHGEKGAGQPNDRLVGGHGSLASTAQCAPSAATGHTP